ncbi:hypothetical protein HMPREF0454_04142 [Hafnia alvei ATCC 51873]|uniref:Uncharacterized protein n=1 Tax=Hafnia alvei ATCC 51873 TaxID=1002364 RepID=G9YC16_HAFAL|nr:hypothetical protein HMPREF0454_04142 [Hafnia alvei ATCC 51873]
MAAEKHASPEIKTANAANVVRLRHRDTRVYHTTELPPKSD